MRHLKKFNEENETNLKIGKTIPRPSQEDIDKYESDMKKFRSDIPSYVHNVDYKIPRDFIGEIMDRLDHKTMGKEYMEEIKKLNERFPKAYSKRGTDIWKDKEPEKTEKIPSRKRTWVENFKDSMKNI